MYSLLLQINFYFYEVGDEMLKSLESAVVMCDVMLPFQFV